MSFLLGHATRVMEQECENNTEVFRELVKHLPSTAEPEDLYHLPLTEKDKEKYKYAQKMLYDAIVKQILDFADEMEVWH